MKIELYTKDAQGKCEPVGEAYTGGFPSIGVTVNSDKGIEWQITNVAAEYDINKEFIGYYCEVKLPKPCDED